MKSVEYRSKPVRYFMAALGSVMGLTAVAFPVVTLAHGLGLLEAAPPWGFFSALIGAFFFAVAAVELFSGHITAYASELVRALADKILGKSGDG